MAVLTSLMNVYTAQHGEWSVTAVVTVLHCRKLYCNHGRGGPGISFLVVGKVEEDCVISSSPVYRSHDQIQLCLMLVVLITVHYVACHSS